MTPLPSVLPSSSRGWKKGVVPCPVQIVTLRKNSLEFIKIIKWNWLNNINQVIFTLNENTHADKWRYDLTNSLRVYTSRQSSLPCRHPPLKNHHNIVVISQQSLEPGCCMSFLFLPVGTCWQGSSLFSSCIAPRRTRPQLLLGSDSTGINKVYSCCAAESGLGGVAVPHPKSTARGTGINYRAGEEDAWRETTAASRM